MKLYLKMSIQTEPDDNGNVLEVNHIISNTEIMDNTLEPQDMLLSVYQMLCRKFNKMPRPTTEQGKGEK